MGSLTHFAYSLVGQLNFLNMCSCCERIWREETRFWSSLETHPLSHNWKFTLTHIHFYSLRFIGNFLIMKNIHIQKKVAKNKRLKKKSAKQRGKTLLSLLRGCNSERSVTLQHQWLKLKPWIQFSYTNVVLIRGAKWHFSSEMEAEVCLLVGGFNVV